MECGTHAREWVSPATCMWLIKEVRENGQFMLYKLLYNLSIIFVIFSILQILKEVRENAGQNKKMCNRIDWVIVPVLNVDGYVHSWTKVDIIEQLLSSWKLSSLVCY